jgi:hypothetical protein
LSDRPFEAALTDCAPPARFEDAVVRDVFAAGVGFCRFVVGGTVGGSLRVDRVTRNTGGTVVTKETANGGDISWYTKPVYPFGLSLVYRCGMRSPGLC